MAKPSFYRRRLRLLYAFSFHGPFAKCFPPATAKSPYSFVCVLGTPRSACFHITLSKGGTAFGARCSRLESRCSCGGLLRQMRKRPDTAQKVVHCAVGCALDSWSSCMFLALKRAISTDRREGRLRTGLSPMRSSIPALVRLYAFA
jgi:hypothetical protein